MPTRKALFSRQSSRFGGKVLEIHHWIQEACNGSAYNARDDQRIACFDSHCGAATARFSPLSSKLFSSLLKLCLVLPRPSLWISLLCCYCNPLPSKMSQPRDEEEGKASSSSQAASKAMGNELYVNFHSLGDSSQPLILLALRARPLSCAEIFRTPYSKFEARIRIMTLTWLVPCCPGPL